MKKNISNKKVKRVSIKKYNAEIEKALKEIDSGKFMDHVCVVEAAKKWTKIR